MIFLVQINSNYLYDPFGEQQLISTDTTSPAHTVVPAGKPGPMGAKEGKLLLKTTFEKMDSRVPAGMMAVDDPTSLTRHHWLQLVGPLLALAICLMELHMQLAHYLETKLLIPF